MATFIKLSKEEKQREETYVSGYLIGIILIMIVYFFFKYSLSIELLKFKNRPISAYFAIFLPYWVSRLILERKRYPIKFPFKTGLTISTISLAIFFIINFSTIRDKI